MVSDARHATAAIIGAGDYIGAAIARRFAAEGFIVVMGRRNGDKLTSLVEEIEASGGRAIARSLDAREEDQVAAFLAEAEALAPLEVCIFNVGAMSSFRCLTPPDACSARFGKWRALRDSWRGARRPG